MKFVAILAVGAFMSLWVTPSAATIILDGPYKGEEVGMLDELKGQGSAVPSGESQELAFISGNLGTDYESLVKDTDVPLYATDLSATENIYAFKLLSDSSPFFLIKNATWRALYVNKAALGWGVIDLDLLDTAITVRSGDALMISHVSQIPEPSALILLSVALLAMGLSRARLGRSVPRPASPARSFR